MKHFAKTVFLMLCLISNLRAQSGQDITQGNFKDSPIFKKIQTEVNDLQQQYNKTCKSLEKAKDVNNVKDLLNLDPNRNIYSYEYEDLLKNDQELASITPWMRKNLDKFSYLKMSQPKEQKRKFRLFSGLGMIVMLIVGFLSLTTCYSAFTSFIIFYQSGLVQKYFSRVSKESFDARNAKSYTDYPYFIQIRRQFSQIVRDPFKIFMVRFACASICIVFMVIGLSMNLRLKSVYNCGVVDAGLAITKGRTQGSYISEFGLFSE